MLSSSFLCAVEYPYAFEYLYFEYLYAFIYIFILMFLLYMKRNEYMDIGKKTENMKVARIQSAVPRHMPLVAGMLHPEEEHRVLL